MAVATMRDLLEAGVHFGHRTPRWNPKMRPFIFGARGGIHIVDLQHTVRGLMAAQAFIRSLAAEGGELIFVGTKQQAQEVVREEAERCGQHYVVHRWLGGTLTNFDTLRTRVQRLRELQARQQAGDFERLSKKAAHAHAIETARLEKRMGGIRNLSRLPTALFIIDPKREAIAVKEARRLSIPIIALTDTNCDPDDVDYVIPGNDDSIRAVRAIAEQIANAVLGGREEHERRQAERAMQAAREAEAAMAAAARAEQQGASTADMEAAMLEAAGEATAASPSAESPETAEPAAPPAAKPEGAEAASRPARARRRPAARSGAAPRGRRKPRAATSPPASTPPPQDGSNA
ncbi:MAG: 30S ribosomal protein S2 [Chloroflexota bacterium]|nr:30S ribosomal protein S2 [Chloroflexota bacterium]